MQNDCSSALILTYFRTFVTQITIKTCVFKINRSLVSRPDVDAWTNFRLPAKHDDFSFEIDRFSTDAETEPSIYRPSQPTNLI